MRTLLLSCDVPRESIEQLSALGYECILLPKHPLLPAPISSHPDSLIFKGEDRLIIDRAYYIENKKLFERISKISGLRTVLSDDALGDRYPADARLNAIVIDDTLYCRLNSISSAVTDYAKEARLNVINTNQGYPACSTLKIARNAVICADRGLARTYRERGISVYEIEAGGIALYPYEYGFIGGASLVLEGKVCFFGKLQEHPSQDIISRALSEHLLADVSLSTDALCDLGGGILL